MATKSHNASPAPKKEALNKVTPSHEKSSYTDIIRDLAKVLDDTKLTEIEFENPGIGRVRVCRHTYQGHSAPVPAGNFFPVGAQTETIAPENPSPSSQQQSDEIVKSPMVGVAYMAPTPGEKNFIAVGARVKKGDTLVIIEAMKVMNPIRSTKDGVVKAILINNEDPVEFDQPLVSIG
ncbi:MAG: acetyl-CoA carboxylase, biotin carboxyl carrier protein [Alphaproteobacteria bacterium]|nr:MAG: acetyl-CoA carboxylase, biotin carboxyl carrier protein [Alphaproteobacteria bacterium]